MQNAEQLQTAILFNGGVTGVRVILVNAAVSASELPQVSSGTLDQYSANGYARRFAKSDEKR